MAGIDGPNGAKYLFMSEETSWLWDLEVLSGVYLDICSRMVEQDAANKEALKKQAIWAALKSVV